VYLTLIHRLREALTAHIREKCGVELPIVLEKPPKLELGEVASPVCFELAKRLKKAPRLIAKKLRLPCLLSKASRVWKSLGAAI